MRKLEHSQTSPYIAASNQLFENRELITVKGASEYLSLSESQIRKLIARGQIPHVQIGRSIRLRVSAIKIWIEKNEILCAKKNRSN
ncbi:MAG: helix-turn-helix domain-containing protein [Bdellovibrionales bacterium]|nr:helix-turn-helix domain-containing protein [Bdellovibrionales bacterium]